MPHIYGQLQSKGSPQHPLGSLFQRQRMLAVPEILLGCLVAASSLGTADTSQPWHCQGASTGHQNGMAEPQTSSFLSQSCFGRWFKEMLSNEGAVEERGAGLSPPVFALCPAGRHTPCCLNGNKYLPGTGANGASSVWLRRLLQEPCQIPSVPAATAKIAARAKAQYFRRVMREEGFSCQAYRPNNEIEAPKS